MRWRMLRGDQASAIIDRPSLEGLDVSLRTQAGEPVLLQLLRLLLPQEALNVGAHVLERFCFATLPRFHFQDVIVPAHLDGFADFAGFETESSLRERRRKRLVIDPAPIPARMNDNDIPLGRVFVPAGGSPGFRPAQRTPQALAPLSDNARLERFQADRDAERVDNVRLIREERMLRRRLNGLGRRVYDNNNPDTNAHHPCRWMMLCLWAASLCPKVVENPVVDEKARNLEGDAHVVVGVVKLKIQLKI